MAIDELKAGLEEVDASFKDEADYTALVEETWNNLILEYTRLVDQLTVNKSYLVITRDALQAAIYAYQGKVDQANVDFTTATADLNPDVNNPDVLATYGDPNIYVDGILKYEKGAASDWGHTETGKADDAAWAAALEARNSAVQSAIADVLSALS